MHLGAENREGLTYEREFCGRLMASSWGCRSLSDRCFISKVEATMLLVRERKWICLGMERYLFF